MTQLPSLPAAPAVTEPSAALPSSAWDVIWTSRSVARNSTFGPEAVMRTFDRIGSVCRRSTIPVTCWSGPRSLSLVVLIFSMVSICLRDS